MRPSLAGRALLLCLGVTVPAAAQQPDLRIPAHATTLLLGLGGGGIGAGAGVELSHRRGAHDLSLRGIGTAQIFVFSGRTRSVTELALLYGWHPVPDRSVLAVRAGVGALWFSVDQSGKTTSTPIVRDGPRLGLAYEVSVTGPISPVFGVGLSFAGSANALKSYQVLLLTLTIGRLRTGAI